MAHVLASVAEYETELRGERVRAGQAVARANGRRWGCQKAEQLGAKTHLAPREIPGVGRFCVLVDPTEGVFALFSHSSS